MIHPSVTSDLAHLHIAELRAQAARARITRPTRGSRPLASLWRRRRRGRAGPPPLTLVPAPSSVPVAPPVREDAEAA